MPATLLLAPTLDAALDHALARLAALKQDQPLAPAWFLLPDSGALAFTRRQIGSTLGVRLFQFYGLAQAILDAAALPVHHTGEAVVRRLVHFFLHQMLESGELDSFVQVWEKPGFQQALLEWLREMKSQGIPPEQVRDNPWPPFTARDRQLAGFYARYQAFLHARRLSDAEGLLWLAAEALENDPRLLRPPALFVIGFDQFNPLQVRILQSLASRSASFWIYLPWDVHHPDNSLAFSRMQGTRQVLHSRLALDVEALEDLRTEPGGLFHLRRSLFEPSTVDASVPADGLGLVAAPSRELEVRRALRGIKALLQQSIPPHAIALLAPQPAVYMRLVETIAEEYGLPVQVERPLSSSLAIATLINLLSLAPDFPWRATLDALRSPYIRQDWLSPAQVDRLERLSRERPVVAGRDQWRFALQPVAPSSAGEDSDLGPPRLASQLSPEALQQLMAGLLAFFDHLTPPVTAGYREYTAWLQDAWLGPFPAAGVAAEAGQPASSACPGLRLWECCQSGPAAASDCQAIQLALDALRGLVEAAELAPLHSAGRLPWPAYRSAVFGLLAGLTLPAAPDQAAGVLFAALPAGRWQSVEHLFILGLSEGEFPRPPSPEVFYSPPERATGAGAQAGAHPLPLARPHPAEDASLWWQVLSNCRRTLTLLRPRLDEQGAPWLPSPYWEEVRQKVPGVSVEEIRVAALPDPAQAASLPELLVALAACGETAMPAELGELWQAVLPACTVLRARQSWQPAPPYEGRLVSPALQAALAQRYGPSVQWSASRLNRFGACPYSFFAQSALQLEPLPDPVDGLDARQRGSLLHAVLEMLYRRLGAAGLSPCLADQAAALAELEACCDALFPGAPERYGFRPGSLWRYEQHELRRLLHAFLLWECQSNGAQPAFIPYRQELRFGLPAGDLPGLFVEAGSDQGFRLHGVIDRLDRDANGRLRLVDYKSGSTRYAEKDVRNGLAFQAPLYALAVERLLDGAAVAESVYLHLPSRETSGVMRFAGRVAADETVQAAVAVAGALVAGARRGDFPLLPAHLPSGKLACESPCEYAALCRVDRHARAKALRSRTGS